MEEVTSRKAESNLETSSYLSQGFSGCWLSAFSDTTHSLRDINPLDLKGTAQKECWVREAGAMVDMWEC